MIEYKLHINKGLWHVNFYVADIKGKNKRKQLSKKTEMDYIKSCFTDLFGDSGEE